MEKLEGTWKFESIENAGAIEDAMGMPSGAMAPDAIHAMSPLLTFKLENDAFTIQSSCGTPAMKFAVGEEQTMSCPIAKGQKKQTKFDYQEGKFYETHTFGNGKEVVIEKEIDGDTQIVKYTSAGDVVGRAIWRRV